MPDEGMLFYLSGMRIGFDAKRLFNNYTGLGNYSRTLVRDLVAHYPEHEYVLFTPKISDDIDTSWIIGCPQISIVQYKSLNPFKRTFGLSKLLQEKGIDVFHGLSNEVPYGIQKSKIPSVVTIHDVIFKRYPKQYPAFDRIVYDAKTKYALNESNAVVAISSQTKEDLAKYYKAITRDISIIYQSCNRIFRDQNQNESNPGDYFLCVGSVIERKNLLLVAKAMKYFPAQQRTKVVVIGSGGEYLKEVRHFIEEHQLGNWFEWKGQVDNESLLSWYKNAKALIYPSIFEGFGIPVIEALYCGTPVITSNLSSLKEAGGKAAILIDPFDVDALMKAMQLVQEQSYLESRIRYVGIHLKQFDSAILSTEWMDLYAGILHSSIS